MFKIVMFTIILSMTFLTGCTSNKVSCPHDHKIITAKGDSALVHIPYVDVQHEGDTLIVSGALKRHGRSSQSLTAHVDVSVFDEQDKLIKQARSDEIHVPSRRVGKGLNFTRFKVSVPVNVQQNMTVHAQPHSEPSCTFQKS